MYNRSEDYIYYYLRLPKHLSLSLSFIFILYYALECISDKLHFLRSADVLHNFKLKET